MAPRPTEVKLVAKLLESEAKSVTELAQRVILALDESRRTREEWVMVMYDKPMVYAFGPYPTRNQANEPVAKGKLIASHEGIPYGLYRLNKDYQR